MFNGNVSGQRTLLSQLKIFYRLFANNIRIALYYRGMFILWGLRMIMVPGIIVLAWLSVKKAPSNPFSDADYLLYYLMMPMLLTLVECRTIHTIPEEIRDGSLSRNLIKPFNPLWMSIFEHLSRKTLQLAYMLPIVLLIGLALNDRLPDAGLSINHIGIVLVAVVLAIILRFVMTTVLALTGFWIEHVETLHLVVNAGAFGLLGGMIVPLETLPDRLKPVVYFFPFRYSLSFPLELLRGRLGAEQTILGMLIAAAWILVFFIVGKILWKRGLRVYSSYGG